MQTPKLFQDAGSLCSIAVVLALVSPILSGCTDKYQEGFQAGYAQGAVDSEARVRRELEPKIASLQTQSVRESAYAQVASTSSCGGNGITLNGKHYSGGKTGCVKVYSDGRVEKY